MIGAAIDIGTNTVLLLIGRIAGDGAIHTLAYEQRTPRLGRDVDSARVLSPDAMERVVIVLKEYQTLMLSYEVDWCAVAGTSAVRDARNREEFRGIVRKRADMELEILSGQEEAMLTCQGALSGIAGVGEASVVDIGGGSTEIATGTLDVIGNHVSLDLGSVRLTERFFRHDPPSLAEVHEAKSFVSNSLTSVQSMRSHGKLVAVAGTATTLALLDQGLAEFDRNAVTNYRLPVASVTRLFEKLSRLRSNEIRGLSTVLAGREDIITAGTLILHVLMEHLGFSEVIVSERGLRYGLLLREWKKRR